MTALDNLRKIPVKTRLMIGLAVTAVILAVTVTFIRLGSVEEKVASDGAARVSMPPSKEEIGRDKPTDVVRFDDNTAVGQLYSQDEKKKVEEAQQSNSSHVAQVRLRLDAPTNNAPVVTVDAPKPVEQDKLALLQKERREIKESQERDRQARGGSTPFQENPWQTLISAEKNMATDYETALSTALGSLRPSKSLPMPGYETNVNDSKGNTTTTRGSSASGGSAGSAGSGGYEQYLSSNGGKAGAGANQGNGQKSMQNGSSSTSSFDQDADESQAEDTPDYPSERIAKASMTKNVVAGAIPVGTTAYSVLQIGVNTDEISPIRAVTVEKGRLEGAVLTGEPKRVGEKAQLTFTSMSLRGRSYNINAIALDPDTYRSVLADGVDNHTFERYSKLFVSAFVEGYADALSGTQTTTNTDGSSSQTKDPLPDTSSQIKVGIGEVGKKMSPIYAREFERPPTVTIEPNKSIIIMFMQELDLEKPTAS